MIKPVHCLFDPIKWEAEILNTQQLTRIGPKPVICQFHTIVKKNLFKQRFRNIQNISEERGSLLLINSLSTVFFTISSITVLSTSHFWQYIVKEDCCAGSAKAMPHFLCLIKELTWSLNKTVTCSRSVEKNKLFPVLFH